MHWTTVFFRASLFLGLAPRRAFATFEMHFQRQDNDALGPLLEFCTNFEIKGNKLTALCVASVGVPSEASIDLNRCLTNNDGELQFER